MAQTSLPFYRKNQSLHDIEHERPKSMEHLREAIVKAADDVEAKIIILEKEFNGGQSHEAHIRNIVPVMKHFMDVYEWTYINSTQNIKELIDLTLEPSEVFRVDMQAVQTVKDYYRKLIDFLPGRLEEVLEDVERILKILKHYCISFCPTEALRSKKKNTYLETPIHYELKRKEYIHAIRMHLDNIYSMCQDFKADNGVKVKAFGLASNELARAADCGEMPLFLVFPEACFNIKNACFGAKKWVSEDTLYTDFLQHDIIAFESKSVEQERKSRAVRDESVHINHLIKTTRRELDELETEMRKMNKREKQFLAKIDSLEMDIKIMEAEIKEKEETREYLEKKAEQITDWTEDDVEAEKEFISSTIARNRIKIPETKHKIEALKNSQQKLIISKRELLNKKLAELEVLDKKAIMSKGKLFEEKNELKNITESLGFLKDIYMKKSTPDLTKKLFNNMPVQARNLKQLPKRQIRPVPKTDPLEQVTKFVAQEIQGDWPKLYRTLPFYPRRGEVDIDNDVGKVYINSYRKDSKSQAAESLDKWKRVNSLANIKSLKVALKSIDRNDILTKMQRKSVLKPIEHSKRGKQNWNKLQKFNLTLNKIMDFQASVQQKHKSKNEDSKSDGTSIKSQNTKSQSTVPSEQPSLCKKVHFATKSNLPPLKKNKSNTIISPHGNLKLSSRSQEGLTNV